MVMLLKYIFPSIFKVFCTFFNISTYILCTFLLLLPLNITILQKTLQKSSKELEKLYFYPFFEEKSLFGEKNGKSS
jgi:ABC-type tungstate transport system substrate-binding protein